MPETPEPLSARYFALLYSPAPRKRILEALLRIESEVSESLRPGLDHHVAHSRLQWWREECDRAIEGRPQHPLTRSLVDSLDGKTPSNISGFVDVAAWDLAGATFETRRELTAYCDRWAAAMFGTLGGPAPLGAAVRELELLGDVAGEARRGRIRLPLDELEHVNAGTGSLLKSPWPEAVAGLIRSRQHALRQNAARIVGGLSGEQQPALRGILVWGALAAAASQRNERAFPERRRPRRFDGIMDSLHAWRVARQATAGRFRLDREARSG